MPYLTLIKKIVPGTRYCHVPTMTAQNLILHGRKTREANSRWAPGPVRGGGSARPLTCWESHSRAWLLLLLMVWNKVVQKMNISILFLRDAFEILTPNSFMGEIVLKWMVSWLRKQSRLYVIIFTSPGDTRSLLQECRDAAMPWDVGVSSHETPVGVSSRVPGAMPQLRASVPCHASASLSFPSTLLSHYFSSLLFTP